jgi:hypothetical protein
MKNFEASKELKVVTENLAGATRSVTIERHVTGLRSSTEFKTWEMISSFFFLPSAPR